MRLDSFFHQGSKLDRADRIVDCFELENSLSMFVQFRCFLHQAALSKVFSGEPLGIWLRMLEISRREDWVGNDLKAKNVQEQDWFRPVLRLL